MLVYTFSFLRERKTHKHKQIRGIVPGLGGCQNFVYVFFSGHSLWGRKTHKQSPSKKSRDNPLKILFTCFFFMCFFFSAPTSLKNRGDAVRRPLCKTPNSSPAQDPPALPPAQEVRRRSEQSYRLLTSSSQSLAFDTSTDFTPSSGSTRGSVYGVQAVLQGRHMTSAGPNCPEKVSIPHCTRKTAQRFIT